MAFAFRIFSVCPRLWKEDGKLVAATAWRLRILTLGWHYRRVVVDTDRKEIVFYRRFFWFFTKRRRIRFGSIHAITYGHQDWTFAPFARERDTNDLFTTGIRLHDGKELHLFYFFGGGTFRNDGIWPDWMYWEQMLFDFMGTQEAESRVYVNLISKLVGVTVIPGR